MKKVLFVIAALMSVIGCSAKDYVIEGQIGDINGKVSVVDMVSNQTLATGDVVNGSFSVSFDSDVPVFAMLMVDNKPIANVMVDGSPVRVMGEDLSSVIKVTGTPANDAFTEYLLVGDEISQKMQSGDISEEEQMALMERVSNLFYESYEANKDNLFGAYMLCSALMPYMEATEILEAVEGFPKEIQAMPVMQTCKEMAEATMKTEVGNVYTNVVAVDADGKEYSLESVLAGNKYVLLDFWASWCRPCMGEMPYLRAAYEKYHAKGFEIMGVSVDEDTAAWKRAVEAQKMTWLSLHDSDSSASTAYSVSSIPANFLIEAATGKIVAKNLRGEAVEATLAELLD